MAIACSFVIKAQPINFGIKLEPQVNWFSVIGESCVSENSYTGISVGLVMDKPIAENYFFNTGITISMKGGSISCADTFNYSVNYSNYKVPPGIEQSYRLQYVIVPVGLKFKTVGRRNHLFYGETGVDLSVKLHTTMQPNTEAEEAVRYNVTDEIRTFNFGYHIGGGIEFTFNDINYLQLGLAFSQGLLDVFTDNEIVALQNSVGLRMAIYF